MFFQRRVEVHDAAATVFGETVRANRDLLAGKIHIRPAQAKGFSDAGTAGAQEAQRVRELLAATR